MVDVDAGGGGQRFAHGLAHQVVVVVVNLTRLRLIGHHLVDACCIAWVKVEAFVNDLAVLNDVAQVEEWTTNPNKHRHKETKDVTRITIYTNALNLMKNYWHISNNPLCQMLSDHYCVSILIPIMLIY